MIYRLKEPIFEKCSKEINKNDMKFSWKFDMFNQKPCRGMIGCHILESRVNFFTNNKRVSLFQC